MLFEEKGEDISDFLKDYYYLIYSYVYNYY